MSPRVGSIRNGNCRRFVRHWGRDSGTAGLEKTGWANLDTATAGRGSGVAMKTGRPRSIPPAAYSKVFLWYSKGNGYARIAGMLENEGVYTTRGSVERLIKGRGSYQGRRVVFCAGSPGSSRRLDS